ncbi:MAG TPA: signal peptidase I [Oligoflexia bacterium]|nr:signal peptidase I [Oligoflexia bacterium]HMP26777.1 signal peptidase I [Oligoflexia bacterium]
MSSKIKEVGEFFKTLLVIVALALLLRDQVVQAFKIPSGSMIPTLQIGDHILVSKFSYGLHLPFTSIRLADFDPPKRGDIVVFTRPDDPNTLKDESADYLIKRVVAIAGDTVQVTGKKLYVNGVAKDEPYAIWQLNGIAEGEFPAQRVPEGRIFLLGDNRDNSKDSRFWDYPFIDIKRVKGKALIIYWSWDSLGRIGKLIR